VAADFERFLAEDFERRSAVQLRTASDHNHHR
jgi:hypothetical protein